MSELAWLGEDKHLFPAPTTALTEPNGLLAAGGDLDPERILQAYQQGIFPWYEDDQPILWWSPDPRMVLFPDELHISKSLKKQLHKNTFTVTYDQAFPAVIRACSGQRNYTSETWITDDMQEAYIELHQLGFAHSAEAWLEGELVGGLYGLSIGKMFFGESMFSHHSNASKVAFVHLTLALKEQGYTLIDCQVASQHLASFGARDISREEFLHQLQQNSREINIAKPSDWPLK